MRRWLVFLLVFVLGLAVLLWFEARQDAQRVREQQRRAAEAPRPASQEPGAPVPEELASKVRDREGQVGEFEARGGGLHRQADPESLVLLYEFVWRDSHPVGEDAYDLEQVEHRRWDPESQALRVELRAARGRARLQSGREVRLDVDYPVTLETVEATIHEGPRFVPLIARVPVLEGVLATEHFTSRERVEIEGQGLVGTGTGLDYAGRAARIELLRDTHVELELDGGAKAVLDADGGLVIGAAPGEERRFVTTRALAFGDVRLVPEPGSFAVDGVFLAERADFAFTDDGLPTQATLEQDPVVELLLRDAGAVRLPGEPALPLGGLPATITGAGPLVLDFRPEPGFVFGGPTTLAVPDLDVVLGAEDSLAGKRSGTVSVVTATGNAVARRGQAVVRCEEIVLQAETGADGRTLGRLITERPTLATSLLPAGEAVLDAQEGLEYVYSESLERLVEARGVTLTVSGPDAFEARARIVRDFDPHEGSFMAQGDVSFADARSTSRAERMDAYSRTHVELTGAPDAPASYELIGGGRLRAYSIEYEGERVTARGDVTAEIEHAGRAHTFAGRWMVVTRTMLPPSETTPAGRERLDLSAGGAVHASVREGNDTLDLAADRLEAVGLMAAEAGVPGANAKLEPLRLSALGSVVFDYRSRGPDGEIDVHGEGARLDVDGLGRGKLLPAEDASVGQEGEGRVRFSGTLPARDMTFDMTAREAEFSPERLVATDVDAEIQGVGVSLTRDSTTGARAPLRAIAGRMSADRRSLLLSESAYLGQTAAGPNTWTLDAERILITGDPDAPPLPADVPGGDLPLHELLAWGGFRATLDESITAEGLELHAERASDLLEMKGAPASISTAALTWTSEWFAWNVRTGFLESGQGRLLSAPSAPIHWEVTYESLEPLVGADSSVQVLRELKATSGEKQLYAAWALFWVDSAKWAGVSARIMSGELTPETMASPMTRFGKQSNNLFALFAQSGISEWLKEAYLEGNIEIRTLRAAAPGEEPLWERSARAGAAYFDLINGRGWVYDAVMAGSMSVGGHDLKVKVRADWLSHAQDGSFEAERAVVTTCEFESPHYEIEIGDLSMLPRLDPRAKERREQRAEGEQAEPDRPDAPPPTDGWNISTKSTGVNLKEIGVRLPLPPISFPVTDDFKVPREEIKVFGLQPLTFGSDARFGTFVALSIVAPLGPVSYAIGRLIDKAMGNVPEDAEGDWSFRPTYLGSRGFGLNVGHTLESKGRFLVENDIALINDTGEDKGLVRVPEDERESLRLWYRMRSRFLLDPGEWLDVVITTQTDPGVQAEFFQNDFLEFEERETYAHWRKADGLDYYYGTAEVQLDSFRTEVVDQPTVGYYRAPGAVGTLWGRPLVYTSNTEVGRLLREEGDPDYEDPFADGLGERDVVRADTTHRLERPAPLGLLGILATPYLEARGTVWDEATGPGSTPVRAAMLAGLELGTSFWRLYESGALHALSPSIGVRSDLVLEEAGQVPVQFDEVESSLDGTFVDLGVRSRWNLPRKLDEQRRFLDLEVRETYATSTDTVDEGWQPVRVNAAYLTSVFGMPFGVTHDGRYDVQTSDTPYSRSYLGVQPIPELVLETGYHSGRDPEGELVYNAISLGGRYTMSDKWQIEGEQTVSTTRDRLSSSLALRRIGHDYVFEVELSFQAGEGGSSLHFSLDPLFLYDPPGLGLLDRWSKEY
jgi:hypothetical protein